MFKGEEPGTVREDRSITKKKYGRAEPVKELTLSLEEEEKEEPRVTKLTKGTNLLKMVNEHYLDELKPGTRNGNLHEKNMPSVVAVSQGWHLCHDKGFVSEFNSEFEKTDSCPSEALAAVSAQNDLGKLFGARPYYNQDYFTVQEA